MANITASPADTRPREAIFADAIRGTRWHFVALCLYFLSQSFTIPLLPLGPSWAIWPGLPDLATALLGVVVLIFGFPRSVQPTRTQAELFRWLVIIFALCVHSFLLFRFIRVTDAQNGLTNDPGFVFGVYQIYRLVQFFFLYWVVIRIPMTARRIEVLRGIVMGVLIVVAAGIFITHYQIRPTIDFVNHLPSDPSESGPWNIYWTYTRLDLPAPFGMVSYNHSYTGVQCLLLLAFFFHLRGKTSSLLDVGLMGIAIFTVFLSESRAGLAAIGLYGIIFFLQKPRVSYLVAMIGLVGSIFLITGWIPNPFERLIADETIERSLTLLNVTDTENLSDRDIIWEQRLNFLNEDLSRWLLGTGFGNTVNSGSNAHMLPLHLIMETGIFGLTIFVALAGWVMRRLWQYDRYIRPMFWGSAMLLFSSATQETFYPVPSLSYFLGLYLVCIAITLRDTEAVTVGDVVVAPLPDEVRGRAGLPVPARTSLS